MKRSEVPVNLTWDLSLIYKTQEDAWKDIEELKSLADKVEKEYKGKLKDADSIVACMHLCERIDEISYTTGSYFELAVETDFSNAENVSTNNKVANIINECSTKTSFVNSEILEADEAVLKEAVEKGGTVSGALKDLLREKPYRLSAETEETLTALGQFFKTPYDVYLQSKLSDIRFDNFTVKGKEYPLSYSLFEENYEYDTDPEVRHTAYNKFYSKLREYENVTATAYNAYCSRDKVMSKVRGHKDVFEYLLFGDKVPRELYDRQIDIIMEKLAPHMRRYAQLIKRVYKLDKMTHADLQLPLDPTFEPTVTIEDAEKTIAEGLSVMGKEYVDMVHQAFKERWIDFATNDGKCTGGFCASPYGVPASFILLSWQNRMEDVFTLAHELGHAGHFKACNAAQGIYDTAVPRYYVEAPSTINELLLTDHLKKTNQDPRFRRWVLACTVGKTYYHNCVTHLLEAAYQREVYKIIDAGGSVQAETLSNIYRDVLKKFWGDTVEIPEGAELTWMRQPHYYMGLYSYSYSASLTIATKMAKRIREEGESAVNDWKKALEIGSKVTPVEFAKMAGVDITTEVPLLDTIEYIGSLIDEIEKLTDEIGDAADSDNNSGEKNGV